MNRNVCQVDNCYEEAYMDDQHWFCPDHQYEYTSHGKIDAVENPVDCIEASSAESETFRQAIIHLSRRLDVLEGIQ